MTAAVYRTPAVASTGIPQTQNTAPVLEFNCLYTHDIRRKNKRWQDGFLRYHTFNKRVMVYDVPRNYIGDAHWTGGLLQEGDEVKLDKDGVIVEVADQVGSTETDLTELRKSAKKGGSSDKGSSPLTAQPRTPIVRSGTGLVGRTTQLKHRSLNALLGAPKGPIGKAAMPTKSPFEQRHENVENETWEEGRPPKRSRIDQHPHGDVGRAHVNLAGKKPLPMWAKTSDAAKQRTKRPVSDHGVIDLREDVPEPAPEKFLPGFSSDALVPPTSPPPAQSPEPLRRPADDFVDIDSVGTLPAPQKAPKPTARPPESRIESEERPTSKSGATLRIAASAPKKKMLLCQDQLTTKPKRTTSTNTDDAADMLLEAAVPGHSDGENKTQRQLLEERLARIKAKEQKNAQKAAEKPAFKAAPKAASRAKQLQVVPPAATVAEPSVEPIKATATAHQPPRVAPTEAERELAELDQMILPPQQVPPKPPEKQPSPPPMEVHREPSPVMQPAAQIVTNEQRSRRRDPAISQPPSVKPKRTPGAPMRFTPSPQKRQKQKSQATDRGKAANAVTSATAAPASLGPKLGLDQNAKESAAGTVAAPAPPPKTTNLDGDSCGSAHIQVAAPVAAPFAAKPKSNPASKFKKPTKAAVTLNTKASGTATVMLGRPFQAPKQAAKSPDQSPKDEMVGQVQADPWSREAFDLFDWRPPNWDEERWCFKEVSEAIEAVEKQS